MGAIRGWLEIPVKDKWLRFHGTQEWYDLWGNSKSVEELLAFFDRYLKGLDNDWESTPKVRMSLLQFGDRGPLDEVVVQDFPVPDTDYQRFYLGPGDSLSTKEGLSQRTSDSLSYDSTDGSSFVSFSHKFDSNARILGIPKVILYMSCDSTDDMDVYVILRKLSKTGEPLLSLNIPWSKIPPKTIDEIPADKRTEVILYTGAIGMLRASHREIDIFKSMHANWPYHPHEREEKIPPGQIVKLEIGIWATGMAFEAGESIQLRISGVYPGIANFGESGHNLNKGKHVVHVGGEHSSHLVLPIVKI